MALWLREEVAGRGRSCGACDVGRIPEKVSSSAISAAVKRPVSIRRNMILGDMPVLRGGRT